MGEGEIQLIVYSYHYITSKQTKKKNLTKY